MSSSKRFKTGLVALATATALLLAGCASATPTPSESPDALQTLTAGKLTIGTGEPAYEPWVVGDAPESGEGFEAAVAYAVAEELGFAASDVVWVRTTFDEAIAPGLKNFDFNLQQYSITDERKAAVDFSSPYYETTQTVITVEGSAAASATTVAELKGLQIGAATGTTSFAAIESVIKPTAGAKAFNSNDDAKAALEAGQIDALVVDLPTALYLTAVELTGGKIVGQLSGAAVGDQFGLVLDKDSPLTAAVTAAVDRLRANGKLQELADKWLADYAGAPVLK
ncbi:ABC transporter substrate-binding protein [Rhodoluna sp. KAS3]|jgi:polar amino acid transport system substrate-binding protein|uniref:ABC transporter substrate-binding protein n=1 Tax=Rhodoluna sp. KAS3 TaxID=942880 RepID=UPI0022327CE8|nr:ABC transporter substrate-binding protein [Rhodoluna sp. KAS3]BDS49655.1 amino acid ABC transporter substrate-binding protein [Rhodoluna sp. KAS3]